MSKNSAASVMIITPILITETESGKSHKRVPAKPGMEFLLDRLSIPRENCYAFGDSPNDLPMLKAAGVSVAMGNAYGGIEEHCTYQTDSVDKDGILHALEHLNLI